MELPGDQPNVELKPTAAQSAFRSDQWRRRRPRSYLMSAT
jgi:hypothetical protein